MKTRSKWLAALLALAAAFALLLGLIPARIAGSAQGVSEETDDELLTSNLIKDGSFEDVTADDTGAWDVDTTSEAAGERGTFEVVEGAENVHSGEKAVRLAGAGNDSGYPEISQQMTVLPNTTYYVTLRVKNNNTAMSSANLFFGFASPEREEEVIYGEQHRWADNSVDKDHIYAEGEGWSEHNGFSLISARIRTGNETSVRFYIRLQKMNATIDDVSVTYAQDIVSTGSENLLKNPGFEDSTNANPLADWITIGEVTNGFSAGIDDVRTTSAYTPGSNMQDKQIEGCNTLYLVAQSGAEGTMTVGQPITVQPDTNYAFYVNLSKWGEAKASGAGVQAARIGILAADMETVLARCTVDGSDISLARYMLASVVANSGENTTVYPFIEAETIGFGTYGAGLYIDECYFFETALDLPEGKENLLSNGDLAENSDGWWEVGGSSQLGWEAGGEDGKAYATQGNIWLSQWSPLDGIVQSVSLKKDQMYKITAYMRPYWAAESRSAAYDGLYSPLSVLVIEGDDETVQTALSADDSTQDLNVVARQNVRVERDDAYMPVTLIFTAPADGEYSVFVGFEGGSDLVLGFQGGVQIGGVSMYETSMEELSLIDESGDYSDVLINTSTDVTVSGTSVTIGKEMSVADFTNAVYAASGYTMSVVDADGNAVTSGNMANGYRVVVKDGGGSTVKEYTVTVSGAQGGGETTTPGGEGDGEGTAPASDGWTWQWAALLVPIAVVIIGAIVAVAIVRKKREK